MRIYLNTRGFNQDYQWFNIAEDNTISISRNWWDMKEISKLPITDDFSITLGKLETGELFLLATDMHSNREDNKGREIRNSFLLISTDEIILRKLAILLLFDYEDLTDKLNFLISDFEEGEFGFSIEYAQIVLAIESLLDRYEVKFEFDANTNEIHKSRFGELFLKYGIQDENGQESIGYRLNPIFEFKLKRFLLSEIFPEDINIIFSFFPHLSLRDIEEAKIYLAVTKTLDKFAKNIFLQDLEDWAKIEMRESFFKKIKEKIKRYRSEIIVFGLVLTILLPLIFSYINLSTLNGELKREQTLLKAEVVEAQIQNKNLSQTLENIKNRDNEDEDYIKEIEERVSSVEKSNDELINKLNGAESVIITLKNSLGKCQSAKKRESDQRSKLAVGYKWYKKLYQQCKNGE